MPNTRRVDVGRGRYLLVCDSASSTQDVARGVVRDGRRHVVGVRAEFQSSGRGRGANRWIAPHGTCLLATYILYPEGARITDSAFLAIGAGVAVAEAIVDLTGLDCRLKWPNDVLLGDRKLAGILIERVAGAGGESVTLAGIGVNVNVTQFPSLLDGRSTSILNETGQAIPVEDLEERVRDRLFTSLESKSTFALVERWRVRDTTTGRRYVTLLDGRSIEGVALGITDGGLLTIETDEGEILELISASAITPQHHK